MVDTEGVGIMPLVGVTSTMGVTGIHWSGGMDQSMFSMMKRLTQKYIN